ncbi:hypothetical protein [Bradyrhizobium tropiciagri]|uniref:hypothetical protein n=1 Tax=Bradyrhizobium tropiciagri TaxID=312253 RepID=UPI00067CA701|nr:hypothetical protein [Bradyrhizobium tropiciagri]
MAYSTRAAMLARESDLSLRLLQHGARMKANGILNLHGALFQSSRFEVREADDSNKTRSRINIDDLQLAKGIFTLAMGRVVSGTTSLSPGPPQ